MPLASNMSIIAQSPWSAARISSELPCWSRIWLRSPQQRFKTSSISPRFRVVIALCILSINFALCSSCSWLRISARCWDRDFASSSSFNVKCAGLVPAYPLLLSLIEFGSGVTKSVLPYFKLFGALPPMSSGNVLNFCELNYLFSYLRSTPPPLLIRCATTLIVLKLWLIDILLSLTMAPSGGPAPDRGPICAAIVVFSAANSCWAVCFSVAGPRALLPLCLVSRSVLSILSLFSFCRSLSLTWTCLLPLIASRISSSLSRSNQLSSGQFATALALAAAAVLAMTSVTPQTSLVLTC